MLLLFQVFFTFWQGVFLAALVHFGVITQGNTFSVGEIQTGLQNFIITLEMFLISIAHRYVFDYKDYAADSAVLAVLTIPVSASGDGLASIPKEQLAAQLMEPSQPDSALYEDAPVF